MVKQRIKRSEEDAKAAGLRLQRLRDLLSLSRKEFSAKFNINLNTLKSWEVGKGNGIQPANAEELIPLINQEKIDVTADWLIYGIGTPPTVIVHNPPINTVEQEAAAIQEEITFLKNAYGNIAILQVSDDAMAPYYTEGEWVGGVKVCGHHIVSLIGKDCLVEIKGALLLRRLKAGSTPQTFHLVSLNIESPSALSMIYDVTLSFAAEVIWRRKAYQCFDHAE